jgi:aconitate hydratase
MELDLSTVQPSLAGPKRPHDKVNLVDMKTDFTSSLVNKIGFKGYGLSQEQTKTKGKFTY